MKRKSNERLKHESEKITWTRLNWSQLCPDIFAENLCKIYNRSIETKCYPEALKLAKVIALYKKGPKYDTGNYRPISLLSYFDKIFEKLVKFVNVWSPS